MNGGENVLQVVIQMIMRGDAAKVSKEQVNELIKLQDQLNAKQNRSEGDERKLKNLKEITAALKEQKDAVKQEKAASDEVPPVIKAVTEATEKASDSKKKLMEAIKGAALSFPGFAQAARLITNPLSIIAAAAGFAAAAIGSFLQKIDEASGRASAFAQIGDGLNSLKETMLALQQAQSGFDRTMDSIGKNMDEPINKFAEFNRQLMLTEQLVQKLEDAELKNTMAGIDARLKSGAITPAQAAMETRTANASATERRDQRAEENLRKQADMARNLAAEAMANKGPLEQQRDAARGQMPNAVEAARNAEIEREKGEVGRAERLQKLREEIGLLKEFESGKGVGDVLMMGRLAAMIGPAGNMGLSAAAAMTPGGASNERKRREGELTDLLKEQQREKDLIAQENAAVQKLTATIQAVDAELQKLQTTGFALAQQSKQFSDEASARFNNRTAVGDINADTEQKERTADAFERVQKERAQREQEAAQVFRRGGSVPGMDFDAETGKATMQAVEALQLQNELLRELGVLINQGNRSLQSTNSQLRNNR